RESYADFVAELVRLKVDVIVTDSTDAAPACEEGHQHDPYCDDEGYRSCRGRTCHQPCQARRERHGAVISYWGIGGKTLGPSPGDHTEKLSSGHSGAGKSNGVPLSERGDRTPGGAG